MINKVTLIGNLGRDPELRHLENGTAVAKFALATNENYRDRNGEWKTETEWHDVVVWRQAAERIAKDLHKGSLAFVEGKITHRKWVDKEGKDHYVTEIVASNVKSLEKREGAGNKNYGDNFPSATEAPASRSEHAIKDMPPALSGENDDLPF